MPFAPSRVLAPSSKARSDKQDKQTRTRPVSSPVTSAGGHQEDAGSRTPGRQEGPEDSRMTKEGHRVRKHCHRTAGGHRPGRDTTRTPAQGQQEEKKGRRRGQRTGGDGPWFQIHFLYKQGIDHDTMFVGKSKLVPSQWVEPRFPWLRSHFEGLSKADAEECVSLWMYLEPDFVRKKMGQSISR